jgi:Rieske Fe-S protein
MAIDRRRFIGLSALALAGSTLPACASVAMRRVVPTDGAVRLPLVDYPELTRPGGYLKVLPEGAANPLYVLAVEGGGFVAVSPICTHLGCTVDIQGYQLVCPCHGSTYDRAGQVLKGPAERPLQRFPTAVSGEALIVRLEGAA